MHEPIMYNWLKRNTEGKTSMMEIHIQIIVI